MAFLVGQQGLYGLATQREFMGVEMLGRKETCLYHHDVRILSLKQCFLSVTRAGDVKMYKI